MRSIALLAALGVCLPLLARGASQEPSTAEKPEVQSAAEKPADQSTGDTPGTGPVWLRDLPGAAAAAGAADAERLYLPLQTGELISLARESGEVVWTQHRSTLWPPLHRDDQLLVASDTAVHVIDPATGTERTSFPLPAPPAGPLASLGGGVVVSLTSGTLAAFAASGPSIWTASLGDVSRVPAASSGDLLYVALANGRLAALRTTDGMVIWTREIGGTLAAPTVRDGRVYVGSSTRAVYAFDGATGRLLWQFQTGGDIVGTTADQESLYVVALDNVVRALHLSRGSLEWKQVLPTRPLSAPVRSESRLLMGGVRPQLLAFDAPSGEPVTSFTLPSELDLAILSFAPIVFPATPDSRVSVALVTRDRRIAGLALDSPPVEDGLSKTEDRGLKTED